MTCNPAFVSTGVKPSLTVKCDGCEIPTLNYHGYWIDDLCAISGVSRQFMISLLKRGSIIHHRHSVNGRYWIRKSEIDLLITACQRLDAIPERPQFVNYVRAIHTARRLTE